MICNQNFFSDTRCEWKNWKKYANRNVSVDDEKMVDVKFQVRVKYLLWDDRVEGWVQVWENERYCDCDEVREIDCKSRSDDVSCSGQLGSGQVGNIKDT